MGIGMPQPVEAPAPLPPRSSLLLTLQALGRVVVGNENPGRPETDGQDDSAPDGGDATPPASSTPPGDAWVKGYGFDADPCDVNSTLLDFCSDQEMAEAVAWCATVTADPFFTQAAVGGSVLNRTDEEFRARVLAILRACQHGQIGAEVWAGAFAREHSYETPYLASPDAVLPAGEEAVAPGAALATVEAIVTGSGISGDLSCGCSALALIHAPISVVYPWLDAGLVATDPGPNGQLRSIATGNIIVSGPGYSGAGPSPDGEAAGTLDPATPWIYATGIMDARLGPVSIRGAVDRDVNVRTVRATRPASVVWQPCCHVGVAVDLPDSYVPVFPGGS